MKPKLVTSKKKEPAKTAEAKKPTAMTSDPEIMEVSTLCGWYVMEWVISGRSLAGDGGRG